MKLRLAKIESQVGQLASSGMCRTCRGDPFAVLQQDAEGGRQLLPEQEDRVTQELRCRECGRDVKQVVLVTNVSARLPDDLRPSCAADA